MDSSTFPHEADRRWRGLAVSGLLLAVGVSTIAFLRERAASGPAPTGPSSMSATALDSLHAQVGVDLRASPPVSADSVGPVSEAYHVEVQTLQARVAEVPEDVDALQRLATLLHDAHRREDAAGYYERVIELDPLRRQAWLDLADCYGSLVRWSDVRSLMLRMLERFPEDGAALYNLGVAEINVGDVGAAREWWERAAAQDSSTPIAAMARAALERTRGAS